MYKSQKVYHIKQMKYPWRKNVLFQHKMSTECGSLYQFLRKWGSKGQTWAVSLPGEHKSWRGKAKDLQQGAHKTFELTWLQLWRFTQVSITSTVASPPSPSAPPPPSASPTSPGWCLAGLWGVRGTFGGQGRGGGGRLGGGCCWRLWLELWVGACRHCKTEHTPEQKDEKCYHITAQYYTIPAAPTLPQWWWAVSHPLQEMKDLMFSIYRMCPGNKEPVAGKNGKILWCFITVQDFSGWATGLLLWKFSLSMEMQTQFLMGHLRMGTTKYTIG